ncbi:myosin-14-like [Drosophila montana]|uniref:myosin-14-like n=1 Tax=Drosophila montana TaxID=40370 RepID=UPI00313AF4A7
MLRLKLNKACVAQPGHTKLISNRSLQPVVVSAKRFDDIMSRSTMAQKQAALAAEVEERRYMTYLKEGSDWVCSRFTGNISFEEQRQAKIDQELNEAAIRERQILLEDEHVRMQRIMRASQILEELKPGQRGLRHAVIESEMLYQRKFNEALNREIAQEVRQQQRFDEEQCPERLIPFCNVTEREGKAGEAAKAVELRAYLLKDLEERRLQRLAKKKQEDYDVIIERAQYKLLHEKEKQSAKERAERNRDFYRRAYQDALKEKAEIAKYESMCNEIDDRVLCVDLVKRRKLDAQYGQQIKKMRDKRILEKEARAVQLCYQAQADKRQAQSRQVQVINQHDEQVEMDEGLRQCKSNELSQQRRAYELEDRKREELQRQRDAEIRRFQVAERFRNAKANNLFNTALKQNRDAETANLRDILYGQRDEFLAKRQEEQLRVSACREDPYLQEDVLFFGDAVKAIKDARKMGRPIFPIAKAVEAYRRKNQIDEVPEGRMVGRSRIRDYCWPGYYSKAELAYKKYEHREKCRQEQQRDRNEIFNNCIKITKMAAEEQPYKKCPVGGIIKCCQHRGLPDVDSIDSFDRASNIFHEEDALPDGNPTAMQPAKSNKFSQQNSAHLPKQRSSQRNSKGSKHSSLNSNISKQVSSQKLVCNPNCSGSSREIAGAFQLGHKPRNRKPLNSSKTCLS